MASFHNQGDGGKDFRDAIGLVKTTDPLSGATIVSIAAKRTLKSSHTGAKIDFLKGGEIYQLRSDPQLQPLRCSKTINTSNTWQIAVARLRKTNYFNKNTNEKRVTPEDHLK